MNSKRIRYGLKHPPEQATPLHWNPLKQSRGGCTFRAFSSGKVLKTSFHLFVVIAFIIFGRWPLFAQTANESPESFFSSYTQARSNALKTLNQHFIQAVDIEMKVYLKGGDLARANAASDWEKRLADTDEKKYIEGIVPNSNSQDRLIALQSRYLKERVETINRVDTLFLAQTEGLQRHEMQNGDLDAANSLSQFLNRLKAELGLPISGQLATSQTVSDADALFAVEKQQKWKSGGAATWAWSGSKLVGNGAGKLEYEISLQPPFVARFTLNSMAGIREGVRFEDIGLQNAAYSDEFGLTGADQGKYFPFKHHTEYHCVITVNRKESQLFVDGKLICVGKGREKKVSKIVINSGDGWSPGSIEIQDFILLRGTDKAPSY